MPEIEFSVESFQKRFAKEHPIKNWFDNHFEWLEKFGYAPHYVITHPHEIIKDWLREIRWAYQRVRYGHDERVSWSIDYWLNPIMIKELNILKSDKVGVPARFFEDFEDQTTDESLEKAKKVWNAELDKMILGFESAQKISDLDYDWKNKQIENQLYKNFKIGMKSFTENYFSLWD